MGLFDSLFGGNSTSSQDAATQAAIQNLGNVNAGNQAVLQGTTNQGNAALRTQAANATGALSSGFGAGINAVTNYGGQGQATLGSGVNNAVGTDTSGNTNFQPYATSGTAANGMLSNALGLNGAPGNAAATSAFQASPSYQFSVNQATDAATRAAAAAGMGASGNTLAAVTNLGQNLANQNYQQYITNLQGQGAQGLTAASGISGANQTAGGAQLTGGTAGATLDSNIGNALGTLNAGQGTAQSGVDTGLGTALSGNLTGLGVNQSNSNTGIAEAGANLGVADAQAQDAASNANNGILSKALGTFLSPITGAASKSLGGTLSSATGGFL